MLRRRVSTNLGNASGRWQQGVDKFKAILQEEVLQTTKTEFSTTTVGILHQAKCTIEVKLSFNILFSKSCC